MNRYHVEFYNPSAGCWWYAEDFMTKIGARKFMGKRVTNPMYASKWKIMDTKIIPWKLVMTVERDDGDRR